MDVTKLDSIKSAVEFIIQEEGRIDILINNAGAGFNKTTEQATDEEINWQLNLNLMGILNDQSCITNHEITKRRSCYQYFVSWRPSWTTFQ